MAPFIVFPCCQLFIKITMKTETQASLKQVRSNNCLDEMVTTIIKIKEHLFFA
jgi:hypothetical protein